MNEFFSLTINICILIIIVMLVESITVGSIYFKYIRTVVSALVILIIAEFLIDFDFTRSTEFSIDDYYLNTDTTWNETLSHVEQKVADEIMLLCSKNGLDINADVDLETDYSNIKIISVKISGNDKESAKNLVAGYFQIDPAYIIIDGA